MDGKVQFVFKKVAVVEKFFDIIYSVHVESSSGDTQLRGRAGKHCGQKRTYRAVSGHSLNGPEYSLNKEQRVEHTETSSPDTMICFFLPSLLFEV